eukprot:scaffold3187_cov361-Prasinococcus_capsulatus_cf.AAC.4
MSFRTATLAPSGETSSCGSRREWHTDPAGTRGELVDDLPSAGAAAALGLRHLQLPSLTHPRTGSTRRSAEAGRAARKWSAARPTQPAAPRAGLAAPPGAAPAPPKPTMWAPAGARRPALSGREVTDGECRHTAAAAAAAAVLVDEPHQRRHRLRRRCCGRHRCRREVATLLGVPPRH